MIEKLSECAKMEIDKGIENVDTKEMGEVAEIIKELSEAEYYAKISKAMDEAEYGEDYDYMGSYDEHNRKGYRGQPRDSRGRYMSRRRMGYEEPMRMMPEMNREHDAEYYRDMDKMDGRMYYSSGNMGGQSSSGMSGGSMGSTGGQSSGGSSGGSRGYSESGSQGRDSREGRSGQMRRYYMESKEMGKDKGEKMKNLEEYIKELSSDVSEMISDASPEEKTMLRQKLQMLTQKI